MQGLRSLRLLARNGNGMHLSAVLISLKNLLHNFFAFFLAVDQTTRRQYHARYRSPTMNDMPVPEGDYFALHAQRQRKYNAVLATGVSMNLFGLYMVRDYSLFC